MLMARETKSRTAEEINKAKIPDPVVIATAFDKNRWADETGGAVLRTLLPPCVLGRVAWPLWGRRVLLLFLLCAFSSSDTYRCRLGTVTFCS